MNSDWADAITVLLQEMARHPTFTEWIPRLPNRYKQVMAELVERIDPRQQSPRSKLILALTETSYRDDY